LDGFKVFLKGRSLKAYHLSRVKSIFRTFNTGEKIKDVLHESLLNKHPDTYSLLSEFFVESLDPESTLINDLTTRRDQKEQIDAIMSRYINYLDKSDSYKLEPTHSYNIKRVLGLIFKNTPSEQIYELAKPVSESTYKRVVFFFLEWAKFDKITRQLFNDHSQDLAVLLKAFRYELEIKKRKADAVNRTVQDNLYDKFFNTDDPDEKLILHLAYEVGLNTRDLDSLTGRDYAPEKSMLAKWELPSECKELMDSYYSRKRPLPKLPLFDKPKEKIQLYTKRAVTRLGLPENEFGATEIRKALVAGKVSAKQ